MKRKPAWGNCRLCQTDAELVNSHIIPRFHWKRLKKTDGYFYVLPSSPEKPERREQKEVTEPLLCTSCEALLGKNEEHIARVLFGGIKLKSKDNGRIFQVEGFDYTRFKNGLLSILWRMSLSSSESFKEVELGIKHSERIRKIILNAETIDELEYPIICCAPELDGQFLSDWIVTPNTCCAGGNRVYNCLISGLIFTFIVGSVEPDRMTKNFTLKRNASLPILKARVSEIPFLREFILNIAKSQNARNRQQSYT